MSNEIPTIVAPLGEPMPVEVVSRPNPGKALFVWMLISGLAIVGLVVATVVNEIDTNQNTCEYVVKARHDQRAMWLAVFEEFPDSENIENLRVQLDELLPVLTCPPGDTRTLVPSEIPEESIP